MSNVCTITTEELKKICEDTLEVARTLAARLASLDDAYQQSLEGLRNAVADVNAYLEEIRGYMPIINGVMEEINAIKPEIEAVKTIYEDIKRIQSEVVATKNEVESILTQYDYAGIKAYFESKTQEFNQVVSQANDSFDLKSQQALTKLEQDLQEALNQIKVKKEEIEAIAYSAGVYKTITMETFDEKFCLVDAGCYYQEVWKMPGKDGVEDKIVKYGDVYFNGCAQSNSIGGFGTNAAFKRQPLPSGIEFTFIAGAMGSFYAIPKDGQTYASQTGGDVQTPFSLDGYLWVWGKNDVGQLGVGDTRDYPNGIFIRPAGGGNSPIKEVRAASVCTINGRGFAYARDADGDIYATGKNNKGQLGIGNTTDSNRWVSVTSIEGAAETQCIFLGSMQAYILENGSVRGCGINSLGQLGVGSGTDPTMTLQGIQFTGGSGFQVRKIVTSYSWGGGSEQVTINSIALPKNTGDKQYTPAICGSNLSRQVKNQNTSNFWTFELQTGRINARPSEDNYVVDVGLDWCTTYMTTKSGRFFQFGKNWSSDAVNANGYNYQLPSADDWKILTQASGVENNKSRNVVVFSKKIKRIFAKCTDSRSGYVSNSGNSGGLVEIRVPNAANAKQFEVRTLSYNDVCSLQVIVDGVIYTMGRNSSNRLKIDTATLQCNLFY